jgi:hypothetical protein
MLWTDTTWPELDLNEFLSPDPAFPLALGSGMTDFSHLDLSVLSHEMPVFGPDALASPWQDNATASDTARSELGLPEPLPDSAGGLMSRLAAMNLHIVSSTRSLADANPSLLSTTTSSVTALFETASALIGILDTRRARSSDQRGGTPAQYPDPAPDRLRGANRTRSLDPTVCFLVLACHQSLTAAFDTICLSIMAALEGFDPLTNSVFDPSGEVSPGELASEMRGGTMKSPVTQYVMLTALIEHFVERLDRALQSLAHELAAAGEGTAQTPPLDHAPQERTRIPGGAEPPDLVPLAADADPDPNARRPRSTGSGFDSPGPGMDENTSAGGMIESIESEGLANCYRTTMGLARAAQSRHERLLLRLGEVRKLVSASDSS